MDTEKIEKLLKELNIDKTGKVQDEQYVIVLDDSNEYSRVYTKLDKYEGADLDPEEMVMSDSSSIMIYLTDDFDITLKADFNEDRYYLIIEEAE